LPAAAVEKGDILVRLRGIGVIPTDDSGGIAPDLLTSGLEPQPAVVPELDFTYMATKNIGVELILATSPHDLKGTGGIAGLGTAATTMLLPPTLLLQYHFDTGTKFRPYVGAGINYTIAYGENASKSLEATLGPTSVRADDSLGWALQVGTDYDLTDRWFLNFDVKYIDMNVGVTLNSRGTVRTTDLGINPVVVGFGIGYRF
jgi:outer membrane protein